MARRYAAYFGQCLRIAALAVGGLAVALSVGHARAVVDASRAAAVRGSARRDVLFALINLPVGLVLGLLPVALAVWGVLLLAVWQLLLFGLLLLVLSVAVSPTLVVLHRRFCGWLLGRPELVVRIGVLTRTRAQLAADSAAEVRRIERDLHDGAQARLAAVGMTIGLAEQLVRGDPDTALALLAEARDVNGQAMSSLRELVAGIHPPVLTERGLVGAVSALAATMPLPVDVTDDNMGTLSAPIESAAYFAIAEVLANVVKHSRAQHAWVSLRRANGRLVAVVSDDGIGAAQPMSGLQGVARRLAAFDGTLDVASPVGGPTVVTMEVPCASSSPKI